VQENCPGAIQDAREPEDQRGADSEIADVIGCFVHGRPPCFEQTERVQNKDKLDPGKGQENN
jgi:hypothetical protein